MAIERRLIREVRALDRYDLRRLQIFVRGLLMDDEPQVEPSATAAPTVTYRQEGVRCGKAGCTRCPHGPYWYAYWRQEGKLRSRYIGRTLPEETSDES